MPYIGKKPADIIATVIDTTTGTFSGEVDAGSLDVSGNADIDGTTNLDNTDIDGTLDVSGTVTVGNGAVGTPAISFASDTNTGIYRGGTDILKFVTAGTDAITINASQNVGIGTSSPTFSAGGGVHNKGSSGAFTSYRASVDSNTGIDFAQGSDGKGYIYNRDNADLIIATNNTERMRILSDGNVGIGTSSPETILHVRDTSAIMRLVSDTNSTSGVDFGDTADTNIGRLLYDHTDNSMRFTTNTSERMRIDSSGNLLVGKTAISVANVGVEARANGIFASTRSGGESIRANRTSSDGDIIVLKKDNSTVGSIGVNAGRLYIGSTAGNDSFVTFTGDEIYPATSTGGGRDNAINLGTSGARFKDLYLSGGVTTGTVSNFVSATGTNVVAKSTNGNGGFLNYSGLSSGGTTTFSVTHNGNVYAADGINLGGTGSANKLDDYEEGTRSTGSVSGITATTNTVDSFYTKIGRTVIETIKVVISGKSGGSGNPNISLSFTPTTNILTSTFQGGSIGLNTVVSAAYFGVYGTTAQVYANTSSGGYISHSSWGNGTLVFTVIYES